MASTAEKAQRVAEVLALFDHVIESSKAGVRKPDPRIYEMMCDVLGVPPQACIYLDDLGINLKPARAMGMTTIKVTSEQQLLDDLAAETGLSF
jgi:putative hydrolase of the HAD superfamily